MSVGNMQSVAKKSQKKLPDNRTSPSQANYNWQKNMKDTVSTLKYLFDTKDQSSLSDASFKLVAENGRTELVNVHKFVLAARSSVFETMFYGALPETNMPIVVKDISAEIFKTMLQYLYKDDTNCINASNAWKFMYIADKYDIESLKEHCSKIAAQGLTTENLFHCLEQANLFNAQVLATACYNFIDRNTTKLLSSAQFLQQPRAVVNAILERSSLGADRMPEKCIYKAVLRWAEAEAGRQNANAEPTKAKYPLRETLEKTLYLVRFPLMAPADIVQARKEGVLSAEETADLLAASHGIDPAAILPFSKEQRSQVNDPNRRMGMANYHNMYHTAYGYRVEDQCGLCKGHH